jgi:hypothetical protein
MITTILLMTSMCSHMFGCTEPQIFHKYYDLERCMHERAQEQMNDWPSLIRADKKQYPIVKSQCCIQGQLPCRLSQY